MKAALLEVAARRREASVCRQAPVNKEEVVNRLSSFFKDSAGGGAGAFYPTDHIVTVFPTTVEAVRVKNELDLASPAAIGVLEFATDEAAKEGIGGALKRELSKMIGTEAQYFDQDLEEARKGAAFVAAYCPDEESKSSIWRLLKSVNPIGGAVPWGGRDRRFGGRVDFGRYTTIVVVDFNLGR